ncbi:MAG: hypothetical protein BMS9Abin28_1068 [Anaerolineae bacterium]|nr:MAG: hypothetical protein BMS9Abin28_1068 [Anaerolineae bacterium]
MRYAGFTLIVGLALAACGATADPVVPVDPGTPAQPSILKPAQPTAEPDAQANLPETAATDPDLINPRVDDFDAYLPSRLIGPDGIRPIYEPRFVAAADAPLEDDELVIGISIEGEAKAYPITVLRFREMVNDELGGLPILVTW